MLRAAAALAVGAVLWPAGAAWAGVCGAVIDDGDALAASSRLDGAVAALARTGVAASVVVDKGELPASSPYCSGSTELAGSVVVELIPHPWDVRVVTDGSVTAELGQRAQEEINGRLSTADPDVASAVAHGLELVWQAHDRRHMPRLPAVEEAGLAVEAREAVDVPGPWLSGVMSRILAVLALAAGAIAAAGVFVRMVKGHQAVQALRRTAQTARTDLAERYVDLDNLVATIVTEIEQGAVLLHGNAVTQVREVTARREAAAQAAAALAGAALLSTCTPLDRATRAECEEVVDRCGDALAGLEDAVRLLGQSLESAPAPVAGDHAAALSGSRSSLPAADRAS